MKPPTVSVIVTAHNYGRFLEQCLQSVLTQTFQDFEVIVVNDGSTDNTAEVLAAYAAQPRVKILTLTGVGLAAACNAGIREARGEYIMRLDADDFLDPHALRLEADFLEHHPDVGLVYPDFYTVDEQGRFLGYTRVPRVQDGARLLDDNPLAGGAMYRRACYDAVGGYNETLRYQEDYDFWLRFAERFPVHGLGLPLLSYRQHAGSMSRNRANRAAARRFVKRQYVTSRRLLEDQNVLIVLPGSWPGDLSRSEELLCRPIGGTSLIGLAVEQAQACAAAVKIAVVTDHPGVRAAAESAGAEVLSSSLPSGGSSERPDLLWLRRFLHTWSESGRTQPTLLVMASPYCPLRQPERLHESVDTLLIHGCDLVLSVDGESVTPWVVGDSGFKALSVEMSPGERRMVREAGELLAVRTAWLNEFRQTDESLVGCVELLYPEWWCVKDEASWQTGRDLLKNGVQISPSAYLRVEG